MLTVRMFNFDYTSFTLYLQSFFAIFLTVQKMDNYVQKRLYSAKRIDVPVIWVYNSGELM